jgi:hypothetical protein
MEFHGCNRVLCLGFLSLVVCLGSAFAQGARKSQIIVGTVVGIRVQGMPPTHRLGVVVEVNGAQYICMFAVSDSTRIVGKKAEETWDLGFLMHKRVRALISPGPTHPLESGQKRMDDLLRLTVLKGRAR